ncbi:bile acid:Na+ symporter, BASS family [Rubritalea squalenifaciens DSM 18772]|uniref:Bile acid:Na+ symporter, BASS family n=1 Tax=Rubritalea squalenifaciens DSM 18772 TaxID=1123071 RepID=A0A1M6PTP3_9BACT|nr:bile acid:sodium symporter family protein [Rubritalea squalenifaciens]SHK11266.1 bile acid:Na+ symporter, BASS family [Rubritalea squalenifaciens DSM 18772]
MKILATCTNLFWLWTIIGVVWAWFQPSAFTWFLTGVVPGTEIKLLTAGLGVIMLGMGITLSWADFKAVLKTPRQVFLGVAAQFLIMPLLGWSVASLFDLEPMLKLGMILVSCCPGGTASNVICYLARANVALSVLMTMCSTFLAVVLTPYLTKFYASAILQVDAGAMIWSMVTIVLLPVVGGVLINHFFKGKLDKVKAVSPVISVLVIVLIVGGVIGLQKNSIVEYAATLLPAVFILHALGFALGYLTAKLLKLEERSCRTVSVEVGMQNSGLGSKLAKDHFSALAMTPCAISALYHCMIGSLLAAYWRQREVVEDEASEESSLLATVEVAE